jgi:methionine synthase II (cobalamin-independent)
MEKIMSKALTADEMNRILTVAETNTGLKKQLEGLKTTWQLVDSDFASLLSEKESLRAKQEEISKEYENIARNLDKANAKINEILYGNISIGYNKSNNSNAYQNMGATATNALQHTGSVSSGITTNSVLSGTPTATAIQNFNNTTEVLNKICSIKKEATRDSEIKAKTHHYYMDTKASVVEKDND